MEEWIVLVLLGAMIYLFTGSNSQEDNLDYDRVEREMDLKALAEEKKIIRRVVK